MLSERVLASLLDAGSRGVAPSEFEKVLGAEFDPAPPRAAIDQILQRLKEQGVAVLWSRRWRVVASMPWIVGTIRSKGARGLELIPRSGGVRYEVPATRAKGAIPGDLVLARAERSKRVRGSSGQGTRSATILEVLRARSRRFVGGLIEGRRGIEFAPWDPASCPTFGSLDLAGAAAGQWVVVEAAPARKGSPNALVEGRVVERLGSLDDPGVDSLVACRQHGLRDTFPPEVEQEAREIAARGLHRDDLQGRVDRRGDLVVTIDGADAKDFDDAISVARTPVGWAVAVHIADVAHYVREGGAIDTEARRRGTSVYFPDRVIPMLPPVLADDLCSLRPNVDRLAVSALLELDRNANIVRRSFERTVIRSGRRLTYQQAHALLADPGADAGLAELFRAAGEVLDTLRRAREERGSLDVDLPSVRVRVGEASELIGLQVEDRLDSHRLVEELMILANRAVAEVLEEGGFGVLHRVHEQPELEDLVELARALEALGVEDVGLSEEPTAGDIQRLVGSVPAGPLQPVAALRALKSMKRAVYAPEGQGHWALGLSHYLHFTSPIRRYPDLIAHRQLVRMVAGAKPATGGDLEALGVALSEAERAAEAAERDVSHWKRVRALVGREGEVFAVTVTDLQPFGAFVRLDDEWVDGLLPAWAFGEGPWRVVRAGTQLKQLGGPARVRLGDRLQARLVRIDLIRRQIDLEPVDAGNRPASRRVGDKKSPRSRDKGKEKRRK